MIFSVCHFVTGFLLALMFRRTFVRCFPASCFNLLTAEPWSSAPLFSFTRESLGTIFYSDRDETKETTLNLLKIIKNTCRNKTW